MDVSEGARLAGMAVLVVEDEFFLADDLKRALIGEGATVIGPVNTIARARSLAGERRPDLAILDINLKGELIFPFADELRAKDVPFVFTTGYGVAVIPAAHEAVTRWEKPFDARELVQALLRRP